MKKCKVCTNIYKPFSTTQCVCSTSCAIKHARLKAQKQADDEFKVRKREFKANDIKLRKRTAQNAFNAYIRKRDESQVCISCQRRHTGQYHCGHFKTTAARPDLRFNEDNCHKQCAPCNSHLSGNIENYRPNLIERIGRKRFDALEFEAKVKYTCAEYKEIELKYKKKLKDLL